MILIIKNDLWILAFITIIIIRCNIFNSFLPSFSLQSTKSVFIWPENVVTLLSNIMKPSTVMSSSSRSWLRIVNSLSILPSMQVLLASDFLKPLWKGVNYCVCWHIFRSHLQSMNCFRNINILYYLWVLFIIIDSRYHTLHKQILIFTFGGSDYTSIK